MLTVTLPIDIILRTPYHRDFQGLLPIKDSLNSLILFYSSLRDIKKSSRSHVFFFVSNGLCSLAPLSYTTFPKKNIGLVEKY